MADDAFRRIDALVQVGMRLARSAPSGRVLLARIHAGIDPDWIPRPWGDTIAAELQAAADAASEPIETRRVERELREAWGGRPTDELDELDLDPVAVTPTAQVHRGILDGNPVAVKVLRPGLARTVRQDLAVVEGLLSPLASAFPVLDTRAIVQEFRARVLDELDLEHEAGVQRRFHRALRGHPFLSVPEPITRLSHEAVLVSEWVDGVPLWRADDPDRAAAQLVVFAIGSARWGVVHADLHPDDVLVLGDGRLAILDFGATRAVVPARLDATAAALEAFAGGDEAAFAAAVAELGWLPAERAPDAIGLARHALADLAGPEPSRLDSAAVVDARERLLAAPEALTRVIRSGALSAEDLWPARGVAQLFASIARVGATGPWLELARAALHHGWDAKLGSAIVSDEII
jgi:predicted unusual protein kinase regulating ubiquinone biosynthesis (AarF/ABC1/UbiB family)